MLWPDICFATFYALEYLLSELRRCRKRDLAIERLLEKVEAEFEAYTYYLANAIYDYFCLTSFGEARHAEARVLKGWGLDCFPKNCTRNRAYKIAQRFDPQEFLPLLETVFSGDWELGWGGDAWLNIVKLAMERNRLSNTVFIDRAINLEHGNGSCFDKGIIFHDSKEVVEDLLRDINEFEPEEWLEDWPVSPLAHTLLVKAHRLGVLELIVEALPVSYPKGTYSRIQWGEGCPKLIYLE